MTSIFLAPHNDDETLFGSFLIMRYRPQVAVLFESSKQSVVGVSPQMRAHETERALAHLLRRDFAWSQGDLPDTSSMEEATFTLRALLANYADVFDHAFAPAWEDGGHEQHNLVAELAVEAFGQSRLTRYLTYRRGYSKSVSEHEVPFDPDWPAYKLGALGCYVSQIALPATSPWFIDSNLREYVAHPLTYVPVEPVMVLLGEDHVRRSEML